MKPTRITPEQQRSEWLDEHDIRDMQTKFVGWQNDRALSTQERADRWAWFIVVLIAVVILIASHIFWG